MATANSSNRAEAVEKWRVWKRQKANKVWPLTVAPNGQWCKRVRGSLEYFGVLDDPKEAMKTWLAEKDYLLVGEVPPTRFDGCTVAELAELFKADIEVREKSKELATTTARDLRHACKFMTTHLVDSRPVDSLTPQHFASLRVAVAETGRNLRSQKNLIVLIRSIFAWADSMNYSGPVDFGPRFRPPRSDAIEAEQEASGSTRFIDRDVLLPMLEHANPKMRCLILLGINCGFYASDSIAVSFAKLHMDHAIPHHTFARVKNGRKRRAVLWPETVAAIQDYVAHHRGSNDSDRIILNQCGQPYTRAAIGRSLHTSFSSLAAKAKVTLPHGASIGSLRHTYGTVVDLAPDQKMIDLTMGHASKGMQKRIYSQLNLGELDRLQKVADVVRRWLYDGEIT